MRKAKCISIKQPWAHLIVTGEKDIENRVWPTNFRGRVLIHASKNVDKKAYHALKDRFNLPPMESLKVGGIVGGTEIVDCVKDHKSDWFSGPYGFVLKNSCELPFRECKGMLSFFSVDVDELWK